MRDTQREGPEVRKTSAKGKAGSLCESVWSIHAGQVLGLAESPFKAEVFGCCYVKYDALCTRMEASPKYFKIWTGQGYSLQLMHCSSSSCSPALWILRHTTYLPCNSSGHGYSLVTRNNHIASGPLWKVRNKSLSYSQKEKTLSCATNQPKLQAVSPWMIKLIGTAAEWCKEHSTMRQLRLFMAVWEKGALFLHAWVQYRVSWGWAQGCLRMVSHHRHLLARKLSISHCRCALEQTHFYIPSDFRTAF